MTPGKKSCSPEIFQLLFSARCSRSQDMQSHLHLQHITLKASRISQNKFKCQVYKPQVMSLCFMRSVNSLIKCIFHMSNRDCQGHRLSFFFFFLHYCINNINQMGNFFSGIPVTLGNGRCWKASQWHIIFILKGFNK